MAAQRRHRDGSGAWRPAPPGAAVATGQFPAAAPSAHASVGRLPPASSWPGPLPCAPVQHWAGEREAFECWRNANPLHEAAYHAVEGVWQRSAAIGTDPALGDLLRQARRLPPERSRLQRILPKLAIAACLVLAVGLGYYFVQRSSDVPAVEYATATGQQRTVVLDDGSQVVLDTNSNLQVQYGRRERRLTLLRGQVDFQVQHDTLRPFVVHTAGGTVTATGTRFQIHVAGGVDTVTLLQGQVVVAADRKRGDAGRVTLNPGERVAIGADGRLGTLEHLPETELASAQGWTEGMLVVREWPLARLGGEMNRYTETPMRLGDPGMGALPMSGRFKASDQRSFLMSLEYSEIGRAHV